MGLDVGAVTHFMYAFNARESIYEIAEALCGARFTHSYTRVGGVMRNITPQVVDLIRSFLAEMPAVMDDMDRLMGKNRIFVDRMQGVGVLTKEEAVNRSCSGPIARASGVARDLRLDEPYLSYADFDFQVSGHGRRLPRATRCGWPRWRKASKSSIRPWKTSPKGRSTSGPTGVPSCRRRASPDDDRRADLALRGDAQPRHARAQRRSLLRHQGPQRRIGVLRGRRRQPEGLCRRCRPPSFIHFALFPHLIAATP